MAILDRYGNEIMSGAPRQASAEMSGAPRQASAEMRNKPIMDEIATASVHDRYSTYPSNGLTPERLASIFREADMGHVSRQAEMFEEMEEKDCHLGGVLSVRRLAVAGLEWEIHPASDSAQDKKIAEAAREMLQYIENLDEALRDILDAIGKGFSMSEIMWEVAGGSVWCKSVNWVHPKRFTFLASASASLGGQSARASVYSGMGAILKYPLLLTDDAPTGDEVPRSKFIFHRSATRSGIAPRAGILRPCAYMYLFKNYDLKDWVVFNDTFAVPMRVGKYRAGASAGDIDTLRRAIFGLANDAAAVISDSTVIELLESKLRGDTGSFEDFAQFCDSAMSKAVLGHSGASDSTPGRLGGESEASDVRRDLLEADAKSLAQTIRTQLLAPWTAFNYGPAAGVPKFLLPVNDAEDLEKTARIVGSLVKDAGFTGIGEGYIYEKFSIPRPEKGEKTLGVASVPPANASVAARANKTAQHTPDTRQNGFDTVLTLSNRGTAQIPPNPPLAKGGGEAGGVSDYFAAQLSAEAGRGAVEDWLSTVRFLLERSASIEDFRDTLLDLWPDMPADKLADAITLALTGATAAGMHEVISGD